MRKLLCKRRSDRTPDWMNVRGQREPLEPHPESTQRKKLLELVQELGDVVRDLRQHPAKLETEIHPLYGIMMRLRWLTSTYPPAAHEPVVPESETQVVTPECTTIFVVDDNPSVRRALSRLFRSLGHEVEVFASATEFLKASPQAAPACVVLDVRMPRMNGLGLQAELSTLFPDLPIVFITGHGDIDMAVQAMKDGAVDFLPKPFDDQDLIDSVDRALDYHRVRLEEREQRDAMELRVARLSPREHDVFERVVKGMLNKQIGFELGTTEKTVKVHRARVMKKMEAESLADLVRMAERLGIEGPVDPEEV